VHDSPQITPRIMVTTDFSIESERAFYHALAFAVRHQARLTLLHTGSESRDAVPWELFPGVRDTLARWGLLEADAPRSAVAEQLRLGVAKMAMRDDDPRQGITDYLRKHPTDLLVMATEGRTGLARLFNSSVADTVSYTTKSHTLMLPKHAPGFIDPKTGRSSLQRVLCALDAETDPRPALSYLGEWLDILSGDNTVEVLVLHTGEPDRGPELLLPQHPNQVWREETAAGEPLAAICAAARALNAGLVAVSARSPLRLIARMRGSLSDKIMRELGLPLLSIPPF